MIRSNRVIKHFESEGQIQTVLHGIDFHVKHFEGGIKAVGNTKTIIYFVRHADSIFIPNMEGERGLSEKGTADALRIIEILGNELIDLFISSPYERAIQTISGLAASYKKEITIVKDLREREVGSIPDVTANT